MASARKATKPPRSASTPVPGRPVRGSHSGRAIMAAFDLLGRRSTLRVLWELRAAPLRFRELQAACGGLSPTLLNRRLAELKAAAIVTVENEGYALSELGRELYVALAPLQTWATRWSHFVNVA